MRRNSVRILSSFSPFYLGNSMSPVLHHTPPARGAISIAALKLRRSGLSAGLVGFAILVGVLAGGVPGQSSAQPPPQAKASDRESDAARLLEEARRDLANGEISTARQRLAALLQRFPESKASADGRRVLGRLLEALSAAGTSASEGADTSESPGTQGRALASRSPASGQSLEPDSRPSSSRARTSTWNSDNLRAQLDHEFRESTGDRVFFGNASAELGARARQVLRAQAQWLRRHPDVSVTIEAHADDGGSSDFNLSLARQRGEAVRDRLVQEGVAADRLRLTTRGRDLKVASCPQSACAAQNRRVITIIEGQSRTGLASPSRN